MNWIKRNVIFVASLGLALVLLILGGFFVVTKMSENKTLEEELQNLLSEMSRIYSSPSHPGDAQVNNLTTARTNLALIQSFMEEAKAVFGGTITDTNFTDSEFKTRLETTIHQLQKRAVEIGVEIPTDFAFTFSAQRGKLSFSPGSIPPWIIQLKEITAITDILLNAKVNAIEGMRRAVVSPDDKAGTADYVASPVITNDVAIFLPYEVTLRCFSAELGAALEGFLQSSNFFLIKSIAVEPSKSLENREITSTPPGAPGSQLPVRGPARPPQQPGTQNRGQAGALTPFLSEQPLAVTIQLDSVRLAPPSAAIE